MRRTLSAALLILLASAIQSRANAQAAIDDPLVQRLNSALATLPTELDPLGPVQSALLEEGGSHFLDLQGFGADTCITVMAVAESLEQDVDLYLYAGGIRTASRTGSELAPAVNWCNSNFERISLEVRMVEGAGRVIFQVFTATPDTQFGDGMDGRLAALRDESADGFLPTQAPVRGILPTEGEDVHELLLASQHCFVILAVGSSTVTDLDLRLRSESTVLDEDLRTNARPTVRYCTGEQGGRYQLEISMVEGYGTYAYWVLTD
ncbi:MAG: hypothetical protein KC561_01990 [Myxococcales bacterium]|nr:hypothetical protein [Myxococcales bacterium]